MPYNPGIQDRSGDYLAQGIGQLGEGIQRGMMSYQQNKTMASQALGKFEATLQANPDILKFLNPEEPSPNAPSDVVKAYMKLQKDGSLGVRDASMLSTFADTYTKAKEDKQQQEMRAMQMQNMQMQMAEQKKAQAESDQMNARFAQMAALGRNLEGGTQMQPAMQNGPAALMGRAPDGPMALGGADALGRGGNLGGGGVLRPEVSERMKQFMQSGVGNAAAQGIKLTPAQAVALQQSDTTRLGALERATIGAESRLAQQGLRNEMNAMSATAKADSAAAKAEIDALKTSKKDAATAFDETKKLRDEFNAHPNTKSFDVVDNYFERGVKLAQKQTSAGDMGLIFALMKVYDPTSTVREGEYATAANSGSIPQQFLNIYNKTKDGQKLQPEQRAQFVETMAEAADVQHKKLMGTASQYNSIAQAAGLDPNKVVAPSYVSWKPPTISDKKTETQGTAPTGIDSILNKYPPRQGFGPR